MTSSASDALARALFDFDGKRTDVLEAFAADCRADAGLIAELCDFAASDERNLQTAPPGCSNDSALPARNFPPTKAKRCCGCCCARRAGSRKSTSCR